MKANHRIEHINFLFTQDYDFLDGVFFKTAVMPQSDEDKILDPLPDHILSMEEFLEAEADNVLAQYHNVPQDDLEIYLLEQLQSLLATLN